MSAEVTPTMETKRGRLAVIVAVAAALVGGSFLIGELGEGDADREAQALAAKVRVHLAAHDREEIEDLVAEDSVNAWAGRTSLLSVDGHIAERKAEIRDGYVVRYRLHGAEERCVDALWPTGSRFRVVVNGCEPYERPAR